MRRPSDQSIPNDTVYDATYNTGTPLDFTVSAVLGGQTGATNKHRGTYFGGEMVESYVYDTSLPEAERRPLYAYPADTLLFAYHIHPEYAMFQPDGAHAPFSSAFPYAVLRTHLSGWYMVVAQVVWAGNATGWREVQICETTLLSDGVTWKGPEIRASSRVMACGADKTFQTVSAAFACDGHYKVMAAGGHRFNWGAGEISVHVRQTSGGALNVEGDANSDNASRLSATFIRPQYDYWWDSNTPVEP